jgi:dynein heavy chain
MLAFKLMEMAEELENSEFRFFLTGGISLGEALPDCPAEWLSEKLWGEMCRLEKLPSFKGFLDHFAREQKFYSDMYNASAPQDMELPSEFASLNSFQFMCVLRTIRPDMIVPAISKFVID